MQVAYTFEIITPAEAARILQEHDTAVASGDIINRARKSSAIKRYAADMQTGEWNPETAETLKFQTHDRELQGKNLIDGQNRLQAVVLSGQPTQFYVARGVARSSFAYIDGGERRSLRDILTISGEEDTTQLANALTWICKWSFEENKLTGWKAAVTTQRARRVLESHPAIRKSMDKANAAKKDAGKTVLMQPGTVGFLHYVFSRHDMALADVFVRAIATGAELHKGDPFLSLRDRLIDNKGSRRKLPLRDIIALSIKAWNFKRAGWSPKNLRYNHKTEEMPSIEIGRATGSNDSSPDVAPLNDATV